MTAGQIRPETIRKSLLGVGATTALPRWSHTIAPSEPRPAAVLIPLLHSPTGPQLLLTERAAHLNTHAGEVSFPGGAYEADDADLLTTAIRETGEETGIEPSFIEPLGVLGELDTISGYRLRAYVGWVRPGFQLQADTDEVASLIRADAAYALDTGNFTWETRTTSAGTFNLPEITLSCQLTAHRVWGVTGVLLWQLSKQLRESLA